MKYSIILLDPPWKYQDRKLVRRDGRLPKAGIGAGNHYDCMTLDEMAALPILNVCDNPCAVFMWVTGPHIFNPIRLIDGWNSFEKMKKNQLRYTNKAFCWQKITVNGKTFPGRGHWNFHNTEDCLLFMRGSMKVQKIVGEEIREPHQRGEDKKIIHSRKPASTRDKIVEMFGDLPRLEIFATEETPGWASTGLQLDGLDIRHFLAAYGDKDIARKRQDNEKELEGVA